MFMSFKCCDHAGQPQGHSICINMKRIDHIAELGQWTAVAQPMDDIDPPMEFAGNPFDNAQYMPPPAARRNNAGRRPTARVRQPDTFVVTPNCVQIFTLNQHFTVIADYQELIKTLASFNNAFEDV